MNRSSASEPQALMEVKVFGFAEQVGHAIRTVGVENLNSIQLAYIAALLDMNARLIREELEHRLGPDRAYLLGEFGVVSVNEFLSEVDSRERKTSKSSKNNKDQNELDRAFDIFKNHNKDINQKPFDDGLDL